MLQLIIHVYVLIFATVVELNTFLLNRFMRASPATLLVWLVCDQWENGARTVVIAAAALVLAGIT